MSTILSSGQGRETLTVLSGETMIKQPSAEWQDDCRRQVHGENHFRNQAFARTDRR